MDDPRGPTGATKLPEPLAAEAKTGSCSDFRRRVVAAAAMGRPHCGQRQCGRSPAHCSRGSRSLGRSAREAMAAAEQRKEHHSWAQPAGSSSCYLPRPFLSDQPPLCLYLKLVHQLRTDKMAACRYDSFQRVIKMFRIRREPLESLRPSLRRDALSAAEEIAAVSEGEGSRGDGSRSGDSCSLACGPPCWPGFPILQRSIRHLIRRQTHEQRSKINFSLTSHCKKGGELSDAHKLKLQLNLVAKKCAVWAFEVLPFGGQPRTQRRQVQERKEGVSGTHTHTV